MSAGVSAPPDDVMFRRVRQMAAPVGGHAAWLCLLATTTCGALLLVDGGLKRAVGLYKRLKSGGEVCCLRFLQVRAAPL